MPEPRLTYRERRERKAERLRDWADKRESKADAAYEQSSKLADAIPFGQPVLVGHHSQHSDERRRDRIYGQMSASVEHRRKGERMAEKAENIERAAKKAIYSDDPDAAEKLQAKIAKLEHERMLIKQANAAYKAEHRAKLKAMTPYQRDQEMPFRSYVLTNLSGNLNRAKKRLAQMERSA